MGQAKLRGSYEQRQQAAIEAKKCQENKERQTAVESGKCQEGSSQNDPSRTTGKSRASLLLSYALGLAISHNSKWTK